MTRAEYLAVWLSDEYARKFLGIMPSQVSSRWVAIGKFQDQEAIGPWLFIDQLEERRPDKKVVIHTVKPDLCLLRWDGIITIQHLKKGDHPQIGIVPDNSTE